MRILNDIIEEHAEEAAFCWEQRDDAVRAADFDLSDLIEWDNNVDAHLDGLRIAGEQGWEICKELGWELGGEFFAALSLSLIHENSKWMAQVIDAAQEDRDATRGIISAFGWASAGSLRGIVKELLANKNPYWRQLGVAACAVHRVNPGESLLDAMDSDHPGLRARALKACGEMGLIDLLPQIEASLDHENDECRFWASWSGGLLGSHQAPQILELFAAHDNDRRRQAISVFLRITEPQLAHDWLRKLARQPDQLRWALIGSGYQGDPVYLEPLMRQFENEEVARVAGESFQMITGLDIFYESLEVIPEAPEDPPIITDEELDSAEVEDDFDDEDLIPDEDYSLVAPDPEKMAPWWQKHGSEFPHGQRYLCGAPIDASSCLNVIVNGQQRQRTAAALELALLQRGSKLFETRAPGARQQRRLARLTGEV